MKRTVHHSCGHVCLLVSVCVCVCVVMASNTLHPTELGRERANYRACVYACVQIKTHLTNSTNLLKSFCQLYPKEPSRDQVNNITVYKNRK